jgi:hypothetical protein
LFNDPNLYLDDQIQIYTDESKKVAGVIRSFLEANVDPSAAAASLSAICEERVANIGNVILPVGMWTVFCSAVANFGEDAQI